MSAKDDLRSIQSLGDRELSVWLDTHSDASTSLQWWRGILESIETGATSLRSISPDQRLGLLGVGARLLSLGHVRHYLSPSLVAYWQLRLAAVAERRGCDVHGSIEILTPEGASRWAVNNMPASREEAIRYARERASRYRDPDDVFYARAGVACQKFEQNDSRIMVLQDIEMILSALEWIDSSRLENGLRKEVQAWLSIRPDLSV